VLHLVRICLSVCPVSSIYSMSESRRNFKFCGGITIESDTSNSGNKFEVKMLKLKVKVSWNKNVKIVFAHYLHDQWIVYVDHLRQTKTKCMKSMYCLDYQQVG